MQAFVLMLVGGLIQAAGTLVGRFLISLGVGYVAFSGVDTLVSSLSSDVIGRISALSPIAVQLAGVLQVGTCINIMISAMTARLALMGLQSGTITKLVLK